MKFDLSFMLCIEPFKHLVRIMRKADRRARCKMAGQTVKTYPSKSAANLFRIPKI